MAAKGSLEAIIEVAKKKLGLSKVLKITKQNMESGRE